MDTEEGVEVVWNEVCISEKKSTKAQVEKLKQVFDNLIQLDHANLVKFHKYWTDTKGDKRRVIFITEYMSSGSLKQFLKKTKKNNKTLKAWKRWCTQILSALSYLHSCEPPIIHGNLTTDTIFIQHNGLIKIGSVAPDAIHMHVKTYRQEARNLHYVAPEYSGNAPMTTAVDIYSFGICALEMAALEIPGNGDTGNHISEENIFKTLDTLEDPLQKNFIQQCLEKDFSKRPTARELLFHTVLFEVHSLKLLAAHYIIKHANVLVEGLPDDALLSSISPTNVIAETRFSADSEPVLFTLGQVRTLDLEKLLEDVKNGIYPLTAFAPLTNLTNNRPRAVSPELAESVKSDTPEPLDTEPRMVINMTCQVTKPTEVEEYACPQLTILLRMDDKMNRQLTCDLKPDDTSFLLADELVHYGFINAVDRERMANVIEETLKTQDSMRSQEVVRTSPPTQLILQNA
ncbi:hypothetical protein NP493_1442g00026 [Ridgeia piscesae]|uniref:Protein kinase domain-containing protein n=1 Tax=Ridgeia piscesae TaxID=27915 RepID=A0AAD9K4D3_RIDPI|nr:hypothetical protein NP493_1442g00026 [Ridgeia piscesae]